MTYADRTSFRNSKDLLLHRSVSEFKKLDDDGVNWDMKIFKLDLVESCYVERSDEREDFINKKYDDGKPTQKHVIFSLRR